MRRIRLFLLAVLLLVLPWLSFAEETAADVQILLYTSGGSTEIAPVPLGDEQWLFLPAFAREAEMDILIDGKKAETEKADADGGVQLWRIALNGETKAVLHVMHGENLRALFLFSDDPVHRGRTYIEDCLNCENETTGSMAIVDAAGHADHTGRLKQIRGRGNGSWERDKRPYQIKLTERADLLETGVPEEAAETWVLLSEHADGTLLHNRIALDLALEAGMEETSHSEFVDLYYDGEYRGVYLLAEKVEIESGRINETDYDALIKKWNKRIGGKILDLLPVGQEENRFGNLYTWIEGVGDKGDPGAGAYLLEVEHPRYTLSDRCWFEMSDGTVIASKTPENASQGMMRYISEKLEAARQILQNGGVDPQSGLTAADVFDLDSFARLALVGELAYNIDAFTYSSTWFVLPEGADRFRAGPVWDFDLAWRYLINGKNADARGLKNNTGWAQDFYSNPSFVKCMRDIWLSEMAPLVKNILLGTESGQYLQPLEAYHAQIAASQAMNNRIWQHYRDKRMVYGNSVQEEADLLEQFIRQRCAWLDEAFTGSWENKSLNLTFSADYGFADSFIELTPLPWPHAAAVLRQTPLSPATEENYACYRVDAYVSLEDWSTWEELSPVVNGTPLSWEILADGRLHFAFTYEDISYRPVMYNGTDIGHIFNAEQYLENHPELKEICGSDPDALLLYFCEQGMAQGHRGNGAVDAQRILDANSNLWYYYGEDWTSYYWEYVNNGHAEHWLAQKGYQFQPEIRDALSP